jgi:hypothetical protein
VEPLKPPTDAEWHKARDELLVHERHERHDVDEATASA